MKTIPYTMQCIPQVCHYTRYHITMTAGFCNLSKYLNSEPAIQSTPFYRFLRRRNYNQIIYLSENHFVRQRFSSDLQWKIPIENNTCANDEFTPLTCAIMADIRLFRCRHFYVSATRPRVMNECGKTWYDTCMYSGDGNIMYTQIWHAQFAAIFLYDDDWACALVSKSAQQQEECRLIVPFQCFQWPFWDSWYAHEYFFSSTGIITKKSMTSNALL